MTDARLPARPLPLKQGDRVRFSFPSFFEGQSGTVVTPALGLTTVRLDSGRMVSTGTTFLDTLSSELNRT